MALEVNRLNFTSEVNAGLKNGDLSEVLSSLLARRKAAVLEVRKEMTPCIRLQMNNLLILYQGQLDVLRTLLEADQKTLRSNAQSLWENELRFTQNSSGSLTAHCGSYSQPVHDHFPTKSVLVETELKRKMRLLFFQALTEKKPLAFLGPAGTGKTESLKDFCGELGLESNVINCFDTMVWDDQWVLRQPNSGSNFVLIFDEFNRQDTKKQNEIASKARSSGAQFCVTCNPGYQGRIEIDKENVFGPIFYELEVTIPPFEAIFKGRLACEGVVECEDLGVKLSKVLLTCKETLSKQFQYDFGMRALQRLGQAVGSLVLQGKNETQACCEALGHQLVMSATKEDAELVRKLVKEVLGAEVEFPENKSAAECINWWFKNSRSTRNLNVMNCKNVDETVKGVEWSQNVMVVDCDSKDFNGKYVEVFNKAKDSNEKVLLVVKTQVNAATAEVLNSLSDDNHPAPNTVRTVLFNNDLNEWSPAQISRIPSYFTK